MNKPNLFLIGAMKSGSTTLHELLARHPEISMAEPKEPCYFVSPEILETLWPEMWRLGFWRDEAAYLALFKDKPRARYFGESSTDYSKRPTIDGVVEKIAAFNSAARFIYIMRDPIERTLSHYWHMVEHRGETRAPFDAILGDPHYTAVSYYANQLEPYLDQFGRDRVYTVTFEELKSDPVSTMREIYTWLDVEENFVPTDATAAHNVTPDRVRQKRVGMAFLDRLRHSTFWNHVGRICPPGIRSLGVKLVEREIPRREANMEAVIAHLRPMQQAQTNELEALLGRRFDEWTTLWRTPS